MRDVELHRWFSAEELEPCTACGKRAAIRSGESESLLCLECGHVEEKPAPAPESRDLTSGR
jgi:uncharacterized Zn finger protein